LEKYTGEMAREAEERDTGEAEGDRSKGNMEGKR
jgi:hypothetical protein